MKMSANRQVLVRSLRIALVITVGAFVLAPESARCGELGPRRDGFPAVRPFLYLTRPFQQDLFGVLPRQITQMFLAPDGDVFVASCRSGTRDLYRFDADGERVTIHDTAVHAADLVSSARVPLPFCGQILNHSDGFAYEARLENEVIQIDPATALETGLVFPTPEAAYRLATDPRTGALFYLAGNCRGGDSCDVVALDTSTGTTANFVTLPGSFYRAFAFDSDGSNLLLLSDYPPTLLVVEREAGGLVGRLDRTIALHQEPRDIAVLGSGPVVISYLFAEATTFSPGPDVFSIFTAGGFTGGTMAADEHGCLYVWQWGTRFGDGTLVRAPITTSVELGSIVEICAPGTAREHRDRVGGP